METKELLKIAVLAFLYLFVAPGLGVLLAKWKNGRRIVFGLICFMTIEGLFSAGDWGLTLASFPYRGHARGFHFYFVEVFALALIIGQFLENWRKFKWFPPGVFIYLIYCALSLLSIFNAPAPSYALMAAFKAVKVLIIFVAAYNFFRTEEDLQFFLRCMVLTMGWELLVVLKMKYLDGIYQVPGTFEHQNSLSMYTTMIGMVFLAVSLGPKTPWSNWYLLAFLATAMIQQSTLSRAGMAAFAAGTFGIAAFSLFQKFTRRRLVVLVSLSAVTFLGLLVAMDTIIGRFQDYGNEASGKTRELLNQASAEMLADYPLGIGWNNYGLTINKPWHYGRIIDDWHRAAGARINEDVPKGISESHYWLLLAETGYQSLISYLIFILVFLWWNFRAIRQYGYHFLGTLSLGIAMGCGANYVHSFLERVLTQHRNMMLWMLLLAATAKIEVWRRKEKGQRRKKPVSQQKRRFAQTAARV